MYRLVRGKCHSTPNAWDIPFWTGDGAYVSKLAAQIGHLTAVAAPLEPSHDVLQGGHLMLP